MLWKYPFKLKMFMIPVSNKCIYTAKYKHQLVRALLSDKTPPTTHSQHSVDELYIVFFVCNGNISEGLLREPIKQVRDRTEVAQHF